VIATGAESKGFLPAKYVGATNVTTTGFLQVADLAPYAVSQEPSGPSTSSTSGGSSNAPAASCGDLKDQKGCTGNLACDWFVRPDQGEGTGSFCQEKACGDIEDEKACNFVTSCTWIVRPQQGEGVGSFCQDKS
jgi:hypothetical protein